MKSFFLSRLSFATFILISFITVGAKLKHVNAEELYIRDSYALDWDNLGYYLYLPSIVIHHDPGLEDREWLDHINKKYQRNNSFYQAVPGKKNRLVNVFPMGIAICNLPAFLVGHGCAKIFSYAPDGFSPPYQWAMIFSGLLYSILGMWLLRKLLLKFFPDRFSALLMFLIAMGTNLFYYTTIDSLLTHNYLFTLDLLLILLTISWHEHPHWRTALFIGMNAGLITIIRPSEIVWLAIPILWNVYGWGSLKDKIKLLSRKIIHVALLIISMIAVGSLQLFYWKYTTGNWFSYNHVEGFDFTRPFVMEVFFSYKKGWLLYTPLMVFSIAGLLWMWKSNRSYFFPLLFFFILNAWIISSWECWWYGGSFGQRPFVQSYGLMALPLGFLIRDFSATRIRKIISAAILFFLVVLNQFQCWQAHAGIIDPEFMSEKYYWKVFARTSVDPQWKKLLETNCSALPPLKGTEQFYKKKIVFREDFDNSTGEKKWFVCDTFGFSGKRSEVMNSSSNYSISFSKPVEEITSCRYFRARFSYDIFLPAGYDLVNDQINTIVTLHGHRGQDYNYSGISIDTALAKPGTWSHVIVDYTPTFILHRDDYLNAFVWNVNGKTVFIDNLQLEIFEPE
ncbi:MAG: hypothetical protein HY064_07715 [Bacteroidetes bacterium]|nr:hypothetical protein [Bacteroidota bacterium]